MKHQRSRSQHSQKTDLQFEPLESRELLTTFYVALDGNDLQSSGSVSIESPLKTVARATALASPGDTVFIREGVYRETAPTRSGTAGNPVTYAAYNGERVVFSGGDLVTGWIPVTGMTDVWVATVNYNANNDRGANTLFVNGELKFEAREHAEIEPLDIDDWGQVSQGNLTSTTLRANDLIGWGDDFWNGATVRHHTNDFSIRNTPIADYDSSTGTLTFGTDVGIITQKQTSGYYIFDTIKALDQPGEWYKGKAADGAGEQNKLYYKAEPGQNPNTLDIEFKRRAFGFDARSRDHVVIEGIEFRGVSIQTNSSTDHNTYQGNKFYAYDKDNFGRFYIQGDHNVFRDNEVRQLWGSIITYAGVRNEFVNNLVVETGYNGVAKGLIASGADQMLISHNTIRSFAEAFIDGYPTRSEIAYNVFEDGGKLSFDTGVFDADGGGGDHSFSIFHHNIFRDTDSRGIYEGFYGRNNNAVIHHNVFYNFDGSGRPVLRSGGTEFGQVYHNTFITDVGGAPAGNLDARESIQKRFNNNVQISVERVEALGVDMRGNFDYATSDFVNFGGDDFRLAAGSDAIDSGIVIPGINDDFLGAAPDPGAFEFGAPMWQAGHNFAAPPSPVYSWQALPGSNLYLNGQFLDGIGDWTIVSGSPHSADRVSWNLQQSGASLTGTFRTQSVEFTPGESIRRTFNNLQPNTTYTLGAVARVANRLVDADDYNSSSGSISSGSHRNEAYVTGLSAGEWVRYGNVDFGDPGQYDQLDLLHIRDPSTFPARVNLDGITVQVRLDSATGPVIAEFSDLLDGNTIDRWRADRADIVGEISGTHSIYVSASGANSQNIALGSFRLLNQDPPTSDLLSVEIDSLGANLVSASVGEENWRAGYEEIVFTTGPAATSATITFANNGRLNAYLDRMYVIEGRETRNATPSLISSGAVAERSLSASTSAPAPGVTDGVLGVETATGDHPGSWIQVDLGATQPFSSIKLSPSANNPTKLSNFRVSVWSSDPDAGGTELWSQDYLTEGASLAASESLFIQGDSRSLDGDTRLASVEGRFVRVKLLGANNTGDHVLALGEIEVYGFEEGNLAVTDGIATQSSTAAGHEATNANDADSSTRSATQSTGSNSWWQVRFPQAFSIGQIELVNHDGPDFAELSNFTVSVWDEDPAAGGSLLWEQAYFSSGSVGQGQTFTIDGSEIDAGTTRRLASMHTGRVVRVQLNGTNNAGNGTLSLAEVRVAMSDTNPPATNLAQEGATDQRNNFYGDRGSADNVFGFANSGNDGVILPLANFTSALNEPNGWWQVGLQQPMPIDQIVLFNRVDAASRLDTFWVEVWDGDPDAGGSILWNRFYRYSGSSATYSTGTTIGPGGALIIDGSDTDGGLRLDQVTGGQFVRVQMTDSDILSLAEVQVWGPDATLRIPADTTNVAYDLGTLGSSVSGSAEKLSPYANGDLSWVGDVSAVDRGGNGVLDDFVTGEGPATLNARVANGTYRVTVEMGDSQSARDNMALWANGALIVDDIDTAAGQSEMQVFEVIVSDGVLSLSFDDLGGDTSEWAVNAITLKAIVPPPVNLPGDYNADQVVNAADYVIFRDLAGTSASMPNDTTPGAVTNEDYDVFVSHFGNRLGETTTVLIDATTGNGEFAVDDAGQVQPIVGAPQDLDINLSRDRALRETGVAGRGLSIPGWEVTRVSYPGSNAAYGFDGNYGFATNAGAGPGQTGQAFVNSGVIDITSDPIPFDFSAGDVINLSYLLGSDTGGALDIISADVDLIFNAGFASELTHSFSTRSATQLATPAITEQHVVAADADSVTLRLRLDGGNSGVRGLIDRIELHVTSTGIVSPVVEPQAVAPLVVEPAVAIEPAVFIPLSTGPIVAAAGAETVLVRTVDNAAPQADSLLLHAFDGYGFESDPSTADDRDDAIIADRPQDEPVETAFADADLWTL